MCIRDRVLGLQLRVELAKAFPDKLRVALVLGKDDGLADAVTTRRLDAPLHQVLQHRVPVSYTHLDVYKRQQ